MVAHPATSLQPIALAMGEFNSMPGVDLAVVAHGRASIASNAPEDVPGKVYILAGQNNGDFVLTQTINSMQGPMDVVAVLTKVLQEQQKTIAKLSKKMEEFERARN